MIDHAERVEFIQLFEELERRRKRRKLFSYFPELGPVRRELYPKHLKFFEAGARKRERLFMAANRIGKTESAGGYEMALHLTGMYPSWWQGRRFDKPIKAWAAGDTAKTVREIIQFKLLGPLHEMGTGLLPADLIIGTTRKQGVSDAIDTISIRHVSGGVSTLTLKSYDQKRISFQGTEIDLVWLDEECELGIYTECLLRTMTCGGMIMLTFTPLMGMSETVMAFLPGGTIQNIDDDSSKFVIMATWDDCGHLSEGMKKELWDSIPPYQRDARSKGVPQLGSGAIYPVPESQFVVDDFPVPEHWPRLYAQDVGWNRTAVPWGAWDRESDIVYLYSEHYMGEALPVVHAQAIKARGEWIPGVIDPAARGRAQQDGNQLLSQYRDLGLDLSIANNAVEAGIYEVWQRLSTGRLKVFRSLQNWLYEFRLYRRDEKGRIVKKDDHLMDATRYLVMGLDHAKTKPAEQAKEFGFGSMGGGGSWMS